VSLYFRIKFYKVLAAQSVVRLDSFAKSPLPTSAIMMARDEMSVIYPCHHKISFGRAVQENLHAAAAADGESR